MKKILRWFIGLLILGMVLAAVIFQPQPFLFYHDLPHIAFLGKVLYIVILAAFLCLYRILRGPTAADRIVSVDILGFMLVGLCAVLMIVTGRSWYMDIGVAWALQDFVTILALSKYLEGKGFDE
jgi:multicomponent Na+:H+ antiporter subunit F